MAVGEIVEGQQYRWSLVTRLGEGDAGEVYLVESLLERKAAILKRPHRSTFSSEVIRQAAQIETEGKLLKALNVVFPSGSRQHSSAVAGFGVPALLDQSHPGTEFSERFFIVIERAAGLDLSYLARMARFGQGSSTDPVQELSENDQFFVQKVKQKKGIPNLVLLRALYSLCELFETIHAYKLYSEEGENAGLIWNDVKPEHLYWDPSRARFTIIDWGNGQFLEADGVTKDRRYSRLEDYSQFILEMGKFLANTDPDLHAALEWPGNVIMASDYPDAAQKLKEKTQDLLFQEMEGLRDARQDEEILFQTSAPALEQLAQLEELQDRIFGYGELPDFTAEGRYLTRLAARLASEDHLEDFAQICQRAGRVPGTDAEKWRLLEQISQIASGSSGAAHNACVHALISGLNEDWPSALWDLLTAIPDGQAPAWWDEVSGRVRSLQMDGTEELTPFVVVSRLAYTLQARLQKFEDPDCQQAQAYEHLVRVLKDEVVRKWNQTEPDPPDSGLDYQDIERLSGEIGEVAPDAQQTLARVLDQPKAQVGMILDAWGRKEFETARRGLRQLLLWDPDRRRVLVADRAIQFTPAWLERVYMGPKKDELLQDFMTELELQGRELRNQVGPARWLDLILDTLSGLRKGASPADLIAERPEVLNEIFWLNDYDARRPAPLPRTKPVSLERERNVPVIEPFLNGVKEGRLGPDRELSLAESLDTWAPEARGSSARVFLGHLHSRNGQQKPAAIKIMRPDQIEYALPLFYEEAQILTLMRDVPGITGLLECGFIRLEDSAAIPSDERRMDGRNLTGEVLRYGVNEIRTFLNALEAQIGQGWLPYMAMEKRNREENLMVLCDAGYTHGRFLPVAESLRIGIQICEILQAAHSRNVVYRDHKILHYYWLEAYNGVFVIDWNIAKRHPEGLSPGERQFDLVQFGARALHHILTGRPAPGALPLGPTRPDEIERASRTYPVQWTYDDKRLPTEVKDILERVLSGAYSEVKGLRNDLHQTFMKVADTDL